LKEARKLGFTNAIAPASLTASGGDMRIRGYKDLSAMVGDMFGAE
jgi:hypothetical protein